MGEKFDKFCSDLRTKIDDADKHLKGLQASAKNAGQKARNDAKAYLAALEAIEAVVPPSLRKGKFRPPDKLLALLKGKP